METHPLNITPQQFQDFTHFGLSRIQSTDDALTLDELVVEWESSHDRSEINAAIREGLADADAGRHRPVSEVMTDLRQKLRHPR